MYYGRSLKRVRVECICIIPMQGYVDLDLSCTIEFDGADRGCFELRMSANHSDSSLVTSSIDVRACNTV